MQGRLSKWWIVGGYWLVQAVVIYVLTPAVIASAENVDHRAGNMGTFSLQDYAEILCSPEWGVWAGIFIPLICGAQAVFVWPLRRPAAKRERGWPIKASLTVGALGVACLATALTLAVSQWVYSVTGFDLTRFIGVSVDFTVWGGATLLLSWAIATPLLIRFCRRGSREDILSRVAARLFVGTIVETAAIIPLDVMVRKRESCYCLTGTYFALLTCGGIGLFVMGPAILIPLIARRRKRWYQGRCEWCAYDMSATPKAEQCPECGMGWRKGEGVEVTR